MSALSFPPVGQSSAAYALSFTVDGTTVAGDVVLALEGSTVMGLFYNNLNLVDITVVEGFMNQALAKISPATTKANGSGTTKPKPTSNQASGFGTYAYSFAGATGQSRSPRLPLIQRWLTWSTSGTMRGCPRSPTSSPT